MAIILRRIDTGTELERVVALCANEVDSRDGDLYIDDGFHQALANKFWNDWTNSGRIQI